MQILGLSPTAFELLRYQNEVGTLPVRHTCNSVKVYHVTSPLQTQLFIIPDLGVLRVFLKSFISLFLLLEEHSMTPRW